MIPARKTITLTDTLVDKIRAEAKEWGLPDWVYVASLRQVALEVPALQSKLMNLKGRFPRAKRGRPVGSTKKLISSPPD